MHMFIAIAGAGIGGLAAAIALARKGHSVCVFERVAQLGPVGAGIVLAPNATRILDDLELTAALRPRGAVLRTMRICTERGRVLSEVETPCLAPDGSSAPSIAIHRAALHAVLVEQALRYPQLHLSLGDGVTSFTQLGHAVEVVSELQGRTRWDLLVGADGIHSNVRARLRGSGPPRYAGYTCLRGIARGEFGLEGCATEAWGRGRRFGYVPIAEDAVYWFAVKNAPSGTRIAKAELGPWLQTEFARFGSPVSQLIASSDPQAICHHDIVDRPPLPRWGLGRVTLLGDAAHPMTPNLGQGACQAIEDAGQLAHALSETDAVEEALATYEARRLPRANAFVRRSALVGRMAQWENPLLTGLRNLMVALVPARTTQRRLSRDLLARRRTAPSSEVTTASSAGVTGKVAHTHRTDLGRDLVA